MSSIRLILKPGPLPQGINKLRDIIHTQNVAKGFWDEDRNIGEALMLCVTELSEAMEAYRTGNRTIAPIMGEIAADKFREWVKGSFEDELADTIIRVLDLCGGLGIDIESHIAYKLAYNQTRPYKHGKKF